ncbi:probable serine/threonine-protein kinase abkD [Tyto alba]|uniref:probable serine/threonine-protein kinase abkD n=1 Tax=Tyto alba TaxID=56313 RepID=UPI001C67CD5E|nr:probable serine/threonine-protein kinase abkD [Tyto alba]
MGSEYVQYNHRAAQKCYHEPVTNIKYNRATKAATELKAKPEDNEAVPGPEPFSLQQQQQQQQQQEKKKKKKKKKRGKKRRRRDRSRGLEPGSKSTKVAV